MSAPKLHRCTNPKCGDKPGQVGHDFAAIPGQSPMCDKCGIAASDPRFGRLIVKLEIIHFEPRSGVVDEIGADYIACAPQTVGLAKLPTVRRSGAVQAVTCPMCKLMPAYLEACDLAGTTADDALASVPVEIDTMTGTVKIVKPDMPAAS